MVMCMTEFSPLFARKPPLVLICLPQDRAALDALNAILPDAATPLVPKVEDTSGRCEACEKAVWVGPTQLRDANNPFVQTRILCVTCSVANIEPDATVELGSLRPNTNLRPRY